MAYVPDTISDTISQLCDVDVLHDMANDIKTQNGRECF